ncbi:Gfo/Idh/MocA family oxidoreductase [Arsenicitalea aurantiaca]|uniref:Gfo/Idh/MocA family oxidoreductase n=1 Tax=Arsenicitalea aurantiaca TaxID=1783274 RepID=A0A433XLC0_9HYPH|nr:Gfo/Idh/MocA family oxidoreductase [Arsenicitalea aurantiaca]RUT34875.1 Gfo/Idh/MocA family oxidoreductase [Arsenicitalea aurantiaca]
MADKVNIGVIGAGWWASLSHIPALIANPHVDIVAVNRPDREGLDRVAAEFALSHAYTDAAEMLAKEDLAGVVIASPHILHAEHARLALEKGLHVLIEKPMATRAEDAQQLVALAGKKGVQIIMPYGWNYKPILDTAHRLVAEGWVGEVRHVVAQMASALADLFGGEPMVETKDHLFRPPVSTWADPEKSGGYGWGQLTHGLGALFRIVDLEPTGVFARTGLSPAGVDYYDAAVVEFANGATMALSGAATVPKSRGYQIDIRIFGTEGMLLFDIERARVEAIRHDGQTHVEQLPADAGDYEQVAPITRFVDICRGVPTVNPADGTIGMRATLVLDAMYRSARSGRMEEVLQ